LKKTQIKFANRHFFPLSDPQKPCHPESRFIGTKDPPEFSREKQIKGFSREKKLTLIIKVNKEWKELSHTGLFKTRV
jgi:hypothetical protein